MLDKNLDVGKGMDSEMDSERSVLVSQSVLPKTASKGASLSSGIVGVDISVKRHDNHNLELKSLFNFSGVEQEASLDFYLFFPPSVQMREVEKGDLFSDFYSRQRLFIPLSQSIDSREMSQALDDIKRLLTCLSVPDCDSQVEDQLTSAVQIVGGIVGETLKARTSKIKRDLLLIHSKTHNVSGENIFTDVMAEVDDLAEIMSMVRSVTDSQWSVSSPVVNLLDEYIHHVFIETLGKVDFEISRFQKNLEGPERNKFIDGWRQMHLQLANLQKKEMHFQRKHCLTPNHLKSQDSSELLLVRLGQMKKFFQSKMFIDVQKSQSLKKFSEPTAALAACFAGITAAAIQQFGNPDFYQISLQGISFLFFAMGLYALRDRIKDLAKNYLHKRISKYVPDFEYELKDKKEQIGRIKEWLKTVRTSDLPISVRQKRKSVSVSEAESYLKEDVLFLKRVYCLNAKREKSSDNPLSLQETLRINVQRYLKFLDDPMKDITILDQKGRFTRKTSHKMYYLYALVNYASKAHGNNAEKQMHLYRVVLNKNGIQKVIDCTYAP
ncbi:MAG: hypothetical protein JNL11_13670 [Bdellovibrionaceae bacterium]|nr:hypothetical protein [Pseudobdellovibrionaceae bacterium]